MRTFRTFDGVDRVQGGQFTEEDRRAAEEEAQRTSEHTSTGDAVRHIIRQVEGADTASEAPKK